MYKVLGSDKQIYGPVTMEQLRQWVAEGRVNAATLVQAHGGTEWKALASFPEFGLPPMPASPPPVSLPPATQATGNNYAIAGMVLGVLSILCCGLGWVFGILGVVFSCLALNREKHPGYPDTNHRSMALAGLILSIIGLIWHCIPLIVLLSGATFFPHGW
ncbi:MAG TPA: DUF4190 domain-containing protein [Verrucomicrobiae bacterium]|jgi:hypothetical protein|nr:DUF4190 domain-containing protein [Verrucomicrobiae bacterium]